MQETWKTQVESLGRGDPLEEGMATRSNILAWRIPWTEEPDWLQSIALQSWTGLQWLSTHTHALFLPWKRESAVHSGTRSQGVNVKDTTGKQTALAQVDLNGFMHIQVWLCISSSWSQYSIYYKVLKPKMLCQLELFGAFHHIKSLTSLPSQGNYITVNGLITFLVTLKSMG